MGNFPSGLTVSVNCGYVGPAKSLHQVNHHFRLIIVGWNDSHKVFVKSTKYKNFSLNIILNVYTVEPAYNETLQTAIFSSLKPGFVLLGLLKPGKHLRRSNKSNRNTRDIVIT